MYDYGTGETLSEGQGFGSVRTAPGLRERVPAVGGKQLLRLRQLAASRAWRAGRAAPRGAVEPMAATHACPE